MRRIHVLSEGFATPNGRAFLFPLAIHRNALAETGLDIRIHRLVDAELLDCDVLMVDSKFHRNQWRIDVEWILNEFAEFGAKVATVIYCDTTDSTGYLQAEVLPFVDAYAKAQLLIDKTVYCRPMYGHRPYTDYYHRHFGVEDSQPEYSTPVNDAGLLRKLCVSWNSGLADYSLHGPRRMQAYAYLPWSRLLSFPRDFKPPTGPRNTDIHARMSTNYSRETVAWQRRQIVSLLSGRTEVRKISRRSYLSELALSKIAVSPFGYGEITLKDFEAIIAGAVLLKPDMSHLQTWPDLFRQGETILCHRWDLEDFEAILDAALTHYADHTAVAATAQQEYRRHLGNITGAEKFAVHLTSLIRFAENCALERRAQTHA